MVGDRLCFYLDENIQIAVAKQLQIRQIQVVTVRDLKLLGKDDLFHMKHATQMGCVLCTYDSHYLQLASQGIEHAGIILVFGISIPLVIGLQC